jgi:hypothetical protein
MLLSLVVIHVLDGHLFLGQCVAWLTMVGDRAPSMGLQEAVKETFSGEHPCEICIAVQSERRKEREEAPLPQARMKWTYAPVVSTASVTLPAATASPQRFPFPGTSPPPASLSPDLPTPPPRSA